MNRRRARGGVRIKRWHDAAVCPSPTQTRDMHEDEEDADVTRDALRAVAPVALVGVALGIRLS